MKHDITYVAISLANEVFDNTYKVLMTCNTINIHKPLQTV